MGDDDERGGKGGDADRAAILARRQRFIAMALTGFAAAAGCDENKSKGKPDPCLKVNVGTKPNGTPEDPKTTGSATPTPCLEVSVVDEGAEADDEADDASAQPCLSVVPPDPEPEPEPTPTPCLKVAAPEPEPTPTPCLKVAAPKPEPEPKPKPQPCLRVAKPDPDPAPKPKPQPCLKVRKPD